MEREFKYINSFWGLNTQCLSSLAIVLRRCVDTRTRVLSCVFEARYNAKQFLTSTFIIRHSTIITQAANELL